MCLHIKEVFEHYGFSGSVRSETVCVDVCPPGFPNYHPYNRVFRAMYEFLWFADIIEEWQL